MTFAEISVAAAACAALLATLSLATSRSAVERLVEARILPRLFINLVPVFNLAGRLLAVTLTVVGIAWLGFSLGWFSRDWLARYGMAFFLLLLGFLSLLITFRKRS